MRGLILFALCLVLISTTALAQPTPKDLALEAAAGIGGSLVGTLVAAIASTSVIYNFMNQSEGCNILCKQLPPECQELENVRDEAGSTDSELDMACFYHAGKLGASIGATIAGVGSAVGIFGAVSLAARAQGHSGNLIGAAGGALIGALAMRFSLLGLLALPPEAELQESDLSATIESWGNRSRVFIYLAPLATIALVIIGYHYI